MPRWKRAFNAAEARVTQPARGERPPAVLTRPARGWRRVAGVAVPGAPLAIAGLHAAWALGWRWPGGSDEAFAERIVSSGELPPAWATWLVAGLLATAAGIVRATARGATQPLLRAGTWTLAAVLMTRGVAFLVYDTVNDFDTVYTRLDAAVYAPLSLALGLGAASVALQRSATPVAAASGARA